MSDWVAISETDLVVSLVEIENMKWTRGWGMMQKSPTDNLCRLLDGDRKTEHAWQVGGKLHLKRPLQSMPQLWCWLQVIRTVPGPDGACRWEAGSRKMFTSELQISHVENRVNRASLWTLKCEREGGTQESSIPLTFPNSLLSWNSKLENVENRVNRASVWTLKCVREESTQ